MKIKTTVTAGVIALALGLAACGDDDANPTGSEGSESAEAVTLSGEFEPVADAPEGSEGITGSAEQIRTPEGVEVRIELAGLMPDSEYASHVHAGSCDQPDPGGPHFKFDLNGGDTPPNEIHLPFTSDADGTGTATATSEMPLPEGEGLSVVVHLAAEVPHGEAHGSGDGDEDGHSGSDSASEEHESEEGEEHDSGQEMAKGDEGTEADHESGKSKDKDVAGHGHMPKIACVDFS